MAYSGGFSGLNNYESHSGLTYCAIAALKLIDAELSVYDYEKTIEFLVQRQ